MPVKKRFFKKTQKSLGNKSGKAREKSVPVQLLESMQTIVPTIKQQEKISPNNSRSITERLFLRKTSVLQQMHAVIVLQLIFFAFVGCLIFWQLWLGVLQGRVLYGILANRWHIQSDMRLWQSIGKEYPTYRDADFQAAILAYRLHDFMLARAYLQKVLMLDPAYKPAMQLEKMLGK